MGTAPPLCGCGLALAGPLTVLSTVAAGYTQQFVPASLSTGCAVQPFLWYYLGGLPTEQRLSWQPANETNLAPLRRRFFCAVRCATDCGMVSVWVAVTRISAIPLDELGPAIWRGFFYGSKKPTVRLGVGVVGLLFSGGIGELCWQDT
jgi:hypothetical protein